jgi:hypothetical protein
MRAREEANHLVGWNGGGKYHVVYEQIGDERG